MIRRSHVEQIFHIGILSQRLDAQFLGPIRPEVGTHAPGVGVVFHIPVGQLKFGAKSASVRTLYCLILMILGTCSIEDEQFSMQYIQFVQAQSSSRLMTSPTIAFSAGGSAPAGVVARQRGHQLCLPASAGRSFPAACLPHRRLPPSLPQSRPVLFQPVGLQILNHLLRGKAVSPLNRPGSRPDTDRSGYRHRHQRSASR